MRRMAFVGGMALVGTLSSIEAGNIFAAVMLGATAIVATLLSASFNVPV